VIAAFVDVDAIIAVFHQPSIAGMAVFGIRLRQVGFGLCCAG